MSNTENSFEALPFRVKGVIARCRSGERLQKTFRYKETGDTEVTFTFEPSGKRAGPKNADQATKTEFLAPVGDGLFGAETSQTGVARE